MSAKFNEPTVPEMTGNNPAYSRKVFSQQGAIVKPTLIMIEHLAGEAQVLIYPLIGLLF